MAECVPEELPSGRGRPGIAGERKVFEWLQGLPDDCLVYYEPITGRRYPDFVVILPSLGVLVLEVKSWKLTNLRSADSETFHFEDEAGRTMTQTNPVRQAREYVNALMQLCSAHLWGQCLRWERGRWRGRFRFPFAHAVVLTAVTRAQIEAMPMLATMLPETRVMGADELAALKHVSASEKFEAMQRFFDLFQPLEPLGPDQIAALRAIIHPEIVQGGATLKVLDLAQERAALTIGDGHRLVFGVAGSGKTVMLIARVRLLASQRPEARLLVLCFNVTLAAYLSRVLRDLGERVVVTHFDKVVRDAGVKWTPDERNADPDQVGLELLRRQDGDASRVFDALFIDEAQDFAPTWFAAALGLLKNPDEADVFITGDGNQGIFGTGKRNYTWISVGVRAKGRTSYLRRAYRSSAEIMALASRFAAGSGPEEGGVPPMLPDDSHPPRRTGIAPWLLRLESRAAETDRAVRLIQELLAGRWGGKSLEAPLAPEEVAVLYPRLDWDVKGEFERLLENLRALKICYNWLSASPEARRGISLPGVRLQTIHSSKGLQYRAVILLWSDLLPRSWGEMRDPAADGLLLYVGLTRAEDFLAVLASGHSVFTDQLGSGRDECGSKRGSATKS